MNKLLTLTGITLATLALSACSPGINEGIGHRITFDSSGMAVHSIGKPDAHIGKDGSLAIDGRSITVTPAQRVLLQRYYGEARSMMQSGTAVGKQGVAMAEKGIGNALASLLHGDSSKAQEKLETQSNGMDSAVVKLCTDLKALGETQQTLAARIPAFAPYATGDRTECNVTHITSIREGNTTVAKASADATAAPGHPANPSASTSSEP